MHLRRRFHTSFVSMLDLLGETHRHDNEFIISPTSGVVLASKLIVFFSQSRGGSNARSDRRFHAPAIIGSAA